MQANTGFGGDIPGNGDSAIEHLETLLLLSDDENDCDLDLAMSIIHELDISLLESDAPMNSSVSGNPDELRMLQTLYQADLNSGSDYSSFSFGSESFTSTPTASLTSLAQAKRKEKKCTYQNRRVRLSFSLGLHIRFTREPNLTRRLVCCFLQEEIQILRDEVVTLESQVRKLKQVRSRRRQAVAGERSQEAKSASLAGIEKENAELKAAILAQKAQLNNLLENMQANKLIVTTPLSECKSELDQN